MRKFLKIVAVFLIAFCTFLLLISSYPVLSFTTQSDDRSFKLQAKSTVSFFALPGQGCDGKGQIQLRNTNGKVLYDTGVQFGLKCLPPYLFLPKKALILGKPEISDTIFVDVNGTDVTQIKPDEFEMALQIPDDDHRQSILYFLSSGKFGLTDAFLISVVNRLVSAKSEKDFKNAAAIASTIDIDKNNEKMLQAAHQFIASEDPFISREFFDKLYAKASLRKYLRHLDDHYLAQHDPWRMKVGLEILEDSKKLSNLEKKNLLLKYFSSSEPIVAIEAMHGLIRLGFGKQIVEEVVRRYYSAKDTSPYFDMPDSPGVYLQAAFSISGQGTELSKAILYGLAHTDEAYWRAAFYLVRDNDRLNDRALIPLLLSLKAKHSPDSLLSSQVDQIVTRIQK